MSEYVQLRETNSTVRAFLERALRLHGYEPVDPGQDFERFSIVSVDPMDEEAELVSMLNELLPSQRALLLVLREQDLPDGVRNHDRVAGVLVKPISPQELDNALRGTPQPVPRTSSPHEQATAEVATVPSAVPQTAAYSAIGEQRLKAFIRSEQITGPTPSLWRALGFEIALKVPQWAAIEREEARAEAISAWLKDRIDG